MLLGLVDALGRPSTSAAGVGTTDWGFAVSAATLVVVAGVVEALTGVVDAGGCWVGRAGTCARAAPDETASRQPAKTKEGNV